MQKAKYFFGYLMITSVFLSCKKNSSYDIVGEPEVKFFMNNTGFGNTPDNSIGYDVINIPDAAGSGLQNLFSTFPDIIKLPVFATKPVSDNVTIAAELNNSLIDEYNAAHNTNYVAFPDNVLDADDLIARIAAGSTTSDDSIAISTDLSALNTLTEESYMAPIELTSVSNPSLGEITSSTTGQVAYIIADVEQRIIEYNADPADAMGSLINPRSSWDVTFTPAPSITGDILDGSTSTYTRWNESPGQVDVNMQTTDDVTGIRLYTTNSSSRRPTQVEVYLSEDGINYDHVGSPEQDDLTFSSGNNYILFYKAVPAKYIRLKLHYSSSGNSQNRRLAEFDVYAN